MAAYPQKQTVMTFVICTVAVLGVAYYVYGDSLFVWQAKKTSTLATLAVKPVLSEVLPTNNEWKKQFLGSNPNNSNDGNTFKAAPVAKTPPQPEKLTPTEKLGREFMTKYVELSRAGLVNDTASVATVMGQVTASNLEGLASPKVYVQKNIIVTTNTEVAMKAYASSVSYVVNTFMPKGNEFEIAVNAMEQNQIGDLSLIDPIIENYNSMISRLLATPVPNQVARYHLDLINGLSIALYAAQSMRHVDTDPVQALAAISLEPLGLETIETAYINLQSQYAKAGVPFGV